jgi:Arc/MetJ family transcription regulator
MRTTVVLEDELLARAQEVTGITERSAILRAGLEALIQREAARRLARLAGSDPDAWAPARRAPGAD